MKKEWEIKKLGDVFKTTSGGTPLKSNKSYYENGDIPWLRSGEICKDDITKSELFITNKGLQNSSSKRFPVNTVLVALYGATAGQVGILRFESSTNQAICGIFPEKNYLPEFLLYVLKDKNSFIVSQTYGSAQPNLSQEIIKRIPIPIPPLQEQKQIVSILDKCFEEINQAKANIEKNLNNSKEIFQSELNSIFSNKGDGWKEKKLGEVCTYDKATNKRNDLPYVGLENIESNSGRYLGTLEIQQVKSSTFYFTNKHVLYGRLRPYLNKVLIPDFEGHCSTEIFPIKVNNELDRKFLFYWLISGRTVDKINSTWTGARMPRANMNEVATFGFFYPSLEKQQQIVQQLDALSTETKGLAKKYQQKLNYLDDLKKSILQKAFSGELKTK